MEVSVLAATRWRPRPRSLLVPLDPIPVALGIEPLHGAAVGAEHRAGDGPAPLQAFERLAEVRVLRARRPGARGVQRGLAYELPQERRADALRLGHDRRPV